MALRGLLYCALTVHRIAAIRCEDRVGRGERVDIELLVHALEV